ncbi:MAG: tRNA-specific adenosine deaminase [Deltaproteobacteria bacterium GWC2_42_11]|nr:MAG: tRNA-specific adenosine deaminase [Deltaproteobacteria bacterium GWC2_42_11]HBO85268.1 tRNA-specific adenosine deaminase [Deltaproteobacteria bacterium]
MTHDYFMSLALKEAKKAEKKGEVPIGCVIVHGGRIIGKGHNLRETKNDPTLHAEIIALKKASKTLGSWRLSGTTVYVTIEPCIMCMGALILARVKRIVFGCYDKKGGACGSLYDISQDKRLNHRIEVVSGVMDKECMNIIQGFFSGLRRKRR